jgi:hypothetical protein
MRSSGSRFEATTALGAAMKLRRPPYPDVVGTAGYYWVHAGHRKTAINMAIEVIRQAAANELSTTTDDPFARDLTGIMRDWAIESLIQGAWVREYHMWERDTKDYFDGHYVRNGGEKVNWRASRSPHVAKVIAQLEFLSASVPSELLTVINEARKRVNIVKHEADDFATEADYKALATAVASFWETLAPQEEFTPPKG